MFFYLAASYLLYFVVHANANTISLQQNQQDTVSITPATVPVASATSSGISSESIPLATQVIDKYAQLSSSSAITVGCSNCTTAGTLDFSYDSITLNSDVECVESPSDCIKSGSATMQLIDFNALIDVSLNWSDSTTYVYPLLKRAPNFALSIPDIGSVSMQAVVELAVTIQHNGSAAVDYQFEFAMPGAATINLDLASPSNSSVTGFDTANFTSLGFNSTMDVGELTISVALRTEIALAFDIESVTISAGAYVDIPGVATTITPMQNVDENCIPLVNSPDSSAAKTLEQKLLTDAYLLNSSFTIDADYYGRLFTSSSQGTPLYSKNAPLPNLCLNFDSTKKMYQPASALIKKASGAGHSIAPPAGFAIAPVACILLALTLGFSLL